MLGKRPTKIIMIYLIEYPPFNIISSGPGIADNLRWSLSAYLSSAGVFSLLESDMSKLCSKCKQTKTLSEFHKDKNRKDGRTAVCKDCKKDYYQQTRERRIKIAEDWRANNLERFRHYQREYHRKNPPKYDPTKNRKKHYRRRRYQMAADGSFDDYEFKTLCKQYGDRCLACGKKTKLTADHIIPLSAGGSDNISNIQPLCLPCNARKGKDTTDYRTKPGILRWIQKKLL